MSINRDVLASAQCANAFRQIRWSLLFFLLNVRVGIDGLRINLIPDVLGWLVISAALSAIANLSPRLVSIKRLASLLAILSLSEIVQERTIIGEFRGLDLWIDHIPFIGIWGSVPISIVSYVLTTMLIWKLCGLIEEMAVTAENSKVENQAAQYKSIYVVATLLSITTTALALALLPASLVFIMLFIYVGAALFLTLRLLISTEKMCRRYAAHYNSLFS